MDDPIEQFLKSKPEIKLFPEACLRKACQPVVKFDGNLSAVIKMMRQVMGRQKMGVGIAAPQLGLNLKIAVVDVRARVPDAEPLALINPEIIARAGEQLSHEGCMSLPEYSGYLPRFTKVTVRYHEASGQTRIKEAAGLEAICIQHEIDHLGGILFFDRVIQLKTGMKAREAKRKR